MIQLHLVLREPSGEMPRDGCASFLPLRDDDTLNNEEYLIIQAALSEACMEEQSVHMLFIELESIAIFLQRYLRSLRRPSKKEPFVGLWVLVEER